MIGWYQRHISPRFAPRCRYFPSCSAYAGEAIEIHGASKGTLLATWRILRCNPWTKGGADYVPEKGKWPGKPLGHEELLQRWNEEDTTGSAASIGKTTGKDTVPPQAQQTPHNFDRPSRRHDPDTRKD